MCVRSCGDPLSHRRRLCIAEECNLYVNGTYATHTHTNIQRSAAFLFRPGRGHDCRVLYYTYMVIGIYNIIVLSFVLLK